MKAQLLRLMTSRLKWRKHQNSCKYSVVSGNCYMMKTANDNQFGVSTEAKQKFFLDFIFVSCLTPLLLCNTECSTVRHLLSNKLNISEHTEHTVAVHNHLLSLAGIRATLRNHTTYKKRKKTERQWLDIFWLSAWPVQHVHLTNIPVWFGLLGDIKDGGT